MDHMPSASGAGLSNHFVFVVIEIRIMTFETTSGSIVIEIRIMTFDMSPEVQVMTYTSAKS